MSRELPRNLPGVLPGAVPGILQTRWRRLLALLREAAPLAVAFSGGLDSRFLCHAALRAGCSVLALHAAGPHIPRRESADARLWVRTRTAQIGQIGQIGQTAQIGQIAQGGQAAQAGQVCQARQARQEETERLAAQSILAAQPAQAGVTEQGWRDRREGRHRQEGPVLSLHILSVNPLSLPAVAVNSHQRCYACKQALLAALRAALAQRGCAAYCLCDGSQADDLEAFRPGMRALREAGVFSPLAEAGLRKADIRLLAAATGMSRPEQQARPCLLTRLAYGLEPTAELLQKLDSAEERFQFWLEEQGLEADFRLRLRPEPVLQVAQGPARLWPQGWQDRVQALLAEAGFAPCAIVLSPAVSGFFDKKAGQEQAAGL